MQQGHLYPDLVGGFGSKLGYAAHMSHLTRTSAAGLSLEDSLTLEEVAEKVAQGDLSFLHPT